jgi:hypothetical protein
MQQSSACRVERRSSAVQNKARSRRRDVSPLCVDVKLRTWTWRLASGTTQRRGWARVCRGAVPSGAAAARGQSRDAQLAARTPQSPPTDDPQAIFGQDALHAARHSHHAPTTNVNRFLCLLCLFHCLDFLHCFIPLRDPALKQALFVHCPFRPILTNDAPPNYPCTQSSLPTRLVVLASGLQGASTPYIPWACSACSACSVCFVDLAPWPDEYTAAQLDFTIHPV